jgi:RNA polymerase sigma-70 factor (ECF subfamily)
MLPANLSDTLLVSRIRGGESEAWDELIARFEGRLLAFVRARLPHSSGGEDIVQETFIGFLTSLPNYNSNRPLESYLFSIAAHKLTDHLRREGRRPALPLVGGSSGSEAGELPGSSRPASSIARSGERRHLEEKAVVTALGQILDAWRKQGEWDKIRCAELLFVRGVANKDVATRLGISEQTVANQKFDFLARLRTTIQRQGLPTDVFPELADA